MAFEFSVPSPEGRTDISVEPGSSVVFVGANGGGKTRLAVQIENVFNLNAHRISAHRALTLNPDVAKISEQAALSGLRPAILTKISLSAIESATVGDAKEPSRSSTISIFLFRPCLLIRQTRR